jgi:hypothetical protein
LEKCGARNGFLFKRGCKGVMEETAASKKGVAADVPPLEEDAKCDRRIGCLEERCGSRYGPSGRGCKGVVQEIASSEKV